MFVWQSQYFIILSCFICLHFSNSNVVLDEINRREHSAFFNIFSLQMHLFSPEQALCYLPSEISNQLILVVAPWRNLWRLSFSFCITILAFKIKSFLLFSCSKCCKRELRSLWQLLMIYVWQIFWSDSKEENFSCSCETSTDSLLRASPVFT